MKKLILISLFAFGCNAAMSQSIPARSPVSGNSIQLLAQKTEEVKKLLLYSDLPGKTIQYIIRVIDTAGSGVYFDVNQRIKFLTDSTAKAKVVPKTK